jgi:hypothetical protein
VITPSNGAIDLLVGLLLLEHQELCLLRRQVLGIDRVHHVHWRQPLGQQLGGVDIDHDLAIFAAGRRRQSDATDRRQLLSNAVDPVVVKLLFIQYLGGQADRQHRDA